MTLRQLKSKAVWIGVAVAALLVAIVIVSTQAFSSGLTATSEPLQNTGADGVINYAQNWSGASAVITRHESSDLTVNASDQVTSVSVQGNKGSGAVDVKVDLLDASQTVLDTKTVAISTASGSYDQAVAMTLRTIKLVAVAKVLATYTTSGPLSITLDLTDGWDSKNGTTMSSGGTLYLSQTSDNDRFQLDANSSYFASYQFDQTVPGGATIVSAKVYVEHYEENDQGCRPNLGDWHGNP